MAATICFLFTQGLATEAFASTTTVWEPVNVLGAGVDTMADGTTVTVSFGLAGSYDPAFANAAGGDPFFYKTDGGCKDGDARGCLTADVTGTVRFTFDSPRTHIRIHYGYIEFNDPELLTSDQGDVDIATYRVSSGSTGNVIASQPEDGTYTPTGVIDPDSGTASGTVELQLATAVSWIEFQNDFAAQSTYGTADYGQNLVGVSVPVEYAQVTFDSNGGSGSMSSQSAASPTNLSSNAFNRSGFTFSSWNTASDGSGTGYLDSASFPFGADTTLYAIWRQTSSESQNSARTKKVDCASGIFLTITGGILSEASEEPIIYGSCALTPGAPYRLVLSDVSEGAFVSRTLASGNVPASGAFERNANLPVIPRGNYKVVLTSSAPNGQTLILTNRISVDNQGRYSAISPEALQPLLR